MKVRRSHVGPLTLPTFSIGLDTDMANTIRTSDGYTFQLIMSGENKGKYTDGDLVVTKCHYCNGIADPDEGWHVEGNLTCNGCHDEQLHYLHHGEE